MNEEQIFLAALEQTDPAARAAYLDTGAKQRLLKTQKPEQQATLLNALSPDDRTAFLHALPLDLAMQLIATHGAVEEPFPEPGDLVHDDDMDHMEGPMMGGVHVIQADTADDRPTRRRTRRQQP